jgi:thymidylate kinase
MTIKLLADRFIKRKYSVLIVDEYTVFVGGHNNFPPLLPEDKKESKISSNFLLNIELQRKRKIKEWLHFNSGNTKNIIFIDRLLIGCLALRKKVNDEIGYKIILDAIKKNRFIKPNLTFYLNLPNDEKEIIRRRSEREEFKNSEIIYDSSGYGEFIYYINEFLINLNIYSLDLIDIDFIENMILEKNKKNSKIIK